MADKVKFTPDRAGIAEWMRDNLSDLVNAHGEAMAAQIAARFGVDAEAVAEVSYKDGRPRSAVHVQGGGILQARDGAFTQAASARGLEVKAP